MSNVSKAKSIKIKVLEDIRKIIHIMEWNLFWYLIILVIYNYFKCSNSDHALYLLIIIKSLKYYYQYNYHLYLL